MDYTPILKLSLPPFDDVPWDEAINGNFSVIDAALGRFYSVPNLVGVWQNSTSYLIGQAVIDNTDSSTWSCNVTHTSVVAPTTFAATRAANPTYWSSVDATAQSYAIAAANSATAAANSASTAAATATSNTGRNLLHNGRITIQQRGVGPWTTTTSYTADRWRMDFTGGSMSVSIATSGDAHRATIGDESASVYLSATIVGGAGAGDFAILSQYLESVLRLSGKIVTLSFWANATTAGLKLGVGIRQSFGTGGSPSANVDVPGQSVTLTATIARYSLTFAVPSAAGKTFGTTAGSAYTRIAFAFSSGTTSAAILGSPGVQSSVFALWGIQLEVGGTATTLERSSIEIDNEACRRFYQTGVAHIRAYGATGDFIASPVDFITAMRAVPAIVIGGTITNADLNLLGYNGDTPQSTGFRFIVQVAATGIAQSSRFYSASADF